MGVAGAAVAGVGLHPGAPGRAHGHRRGRLVGPWLPSGARRLDRPPSGGRRPSDPAAARGRAGPGSLEERIVAALANGGAYFAAQLRQLADAENEQSVIEALWSLTWAGRVTNDTFAPVRMLLGGGSQAHRTARKAPRSRMYRGTSIPRVKTPPRPPAIGGRWSLLTASESDPTLRATAAASLLLDRYGVVTRGSVQSEGLPGGFAQAYRVLAGFEQAGHCRRGYVIEKLGAAQFAASATVDRLREFAGRRRSAAASHVHPRRDGSREPLRRGAALAGTRGRHPPPRAEGRRARSDRRRRTRPVPRARRQVGAGVHRRRGRARRGRARSGGDRAGAPARHSHDRAGERRVRVRHARSGGRCGMPASSSRRAGSRCGASRGRRGARASTGSGPGG